MKKLTIKSGDRAGYEFIALMAFLTALVAYSIDSLLPAQQLIGADLSPDNPNLTQLIVTIFILGLGVGTLVVGPISDAYGRKPVLIAGAALYIIGAAIGYMSNSMQLLLVSRFIMGLGAAGPRIMSVAIVRDHFSGRAMAAVMSFIMMIFGVVPAIAPTIGAGIISLGGWRLSFVAFAVFAIISTGWSVARLPETLSPDKRRPLAFAPIRNAIVEIANNRIVVYSIIVQTLIMAMLFTVISTTQPIFEIVFDQGSQFPFWFALMAAISMVSSPINAKLVPTLGMRSILIWTLSVQTVFTAIVVIGFWLGLPDQAHFYLYLIWTIGIFFQNGFTLGNLTALSMEPLGHIAGIAASVILAISTILSAVLAMIVGQIAGISTLVLAVSLLPVTAAGLWMMYKIRD